MSKENIIIKNIYYMLTYAFQILHQNQYEQLAVEEFEHIHDLFGAILAKGISRQLKQGLYREYKEQTEDIAIIHGKINITETIQNKMKRQRKINCSYDELSKDNLYNQILKSTCKLLLHQDNVKKERKVQLKQVLLLFSTIQEIELKTISWNRISYDKSNQNYKMLLNICQMIVEGMLLTTQKGEYRLQCHLVSVLDKEFPSIF